MIIREYQPDDKEQVIALLQLNIPEYFSPNEEKDLDEYLEQHRDHYYVVEMDGQLIGAGGFNRSKDGTNAGLSWDFFHPESQGKGIGSALTSFRIERIKEIEGIKTISVRTSQLAWPFYGKFGFETKEIVKDYWDKGFDLYDMDCPIADIRTR